MTSGDSQTTRPPQLEPWQFQPDDDVPGLYLRCTNLEQRDAIMRALGAPTWTAEEIAKADREAAEIVAAIKWE